MIPALKTLQFSSNEDDVRRAALLNELMGNLRTTLGQILSILGEATAVPLPASSVVNETTAGQSAAVGSATTFARGDHTHGTPAATDVSTLVTSATLTAAVQPVRQSMESLRVLMIQLVKLELGAELDRGVEGLDG